MELGEIITFSILYVVIIVLIIFIYVKFFVSFPQIKKAQEEIEEKMKTIDGTYGHVTTRLPLLEQNQEVMKTHITGLTIGQSNLRADTNATRDYVNNMNASMTKLATETRSNVSAIQNIYDEATGFTYQIGIIGSNVAVLGSNYTRLNNEYWRMNSIINTTAADIKTLGATTDNTLNTLQRTFDTSVRSIRNDMSVIETSLNDKIVGVTNVNQLQTTDINALKASLGQMTTEFGTVKTDFSSLGNNVTLLDKAVTGFQTKLSTYDQGLAAIDSLRTSITSIQDKNTAQDQQFATITNDITSVNNKLSTYDQSFSTLNNKISTYDQSFSTLNNKISTYDQSLSTLDNKMSTYDQSFSTLNNNITSLQTKTAGYDTSLSTLTGDVSSLRTTLNSTIATNTATDTRQDTSLETIQRQVNTAIGILNIKPLIEIDASAITNSIGTAVTSITNLGTLSIAGTGNNGVRMQQEATGQRYLQFIRSSQGFIQFPDINWDLATSGGLTGFFVTKFTSVGNNERLMDLGNKVIFGRSTTSSTGIFRTNGTSQVNVSASGFLDTTWHIYCFRTKHTTNNTARTTQLYRDTIVNKLAEVSSNVGLTSFTSNANYIGRSSTSTDAYLNANMRHLAIYNSALSDADMNAVLTALKEKWSMP